MADKVETENRISNFFNRESRGYKKRHEVNGIPSSMEFQVESLIESQVDTILDVGSGPGSLVLELAKRGDARLIGLDLSEEMINVAEERIKEEGFGDRISFKQGSFIDFNTDEAIEGISLHRVICCHPDRQGMLQSCQKIRPKIITICVMRDWKALKALMGVIGVITGIFRVFRPYIHSQKAIDQQLEADGYQVKSRLKGKVWVTTTYTLKE